MTVPILFISCCSVLSCVRLFATPWNIASQASLSSTISQSLLKFMSIESVMLSNHLILCHPLLLLPSVFPSIMVFSSESSLHIRRPKYWSFNFSINPSNEYSGLISFRISLISLQSKGLSRAFSRTTTHNSVLWCSVFFMVQLTSIHDYWKDHSFDYNHLCQQSDVSAF